MGGVNWKKEEIDFLIKNYPDKDQDFILKNLKGRKWKAIRLKAHFIGLHRNSEMAGQLRAKTNLKKYGVENPFQSEKIKEKIKETNLEKYGVENPQQLKEIKEKTMLTNLEKYGAAHTFQSEEIKEKIKETILERYGVEYAMESKQVQETMKQNNLKKYGVTSIAKLPSVKEKIKETCLEKYGAEHALQNKEVYSTLKKTNLVKYGVENVFQNETIKEKIKDTNKERYGVENPQQSKEIKEKTEQTNLKRYGVLHTFQSEEIKEKIKEANLEKYGCSNPMHSKLIKNKNIKKYGFPYLSNSPEANKKRRETNLKRYGVEIPSQSSEVQKKITMSKKENNSFHISKPEEEIYLLLKKIFSNLTIKRNYSEDERYPHACDFYIQELDFFIEYQGTWSHGDEPYNGENLPKDWVSKQEKSKYYKNAIEIYTKRDPAKREDASKNNLNYLELWNSDYLKGSDYLSMLILKQGLPLSYEVEVLNKEFEGIKNKPGNFLSNSYQNKIAEHFQPHFYKKERKLWNYPQVREDLIQNREFYKNKDYFDLTIKQCLQGFKISGIHRGFSFFSPLWIKGFIEKYNIQSIYDPCMGWGQRLLGAENIRYIGNDSNKETYNGNKKIAEHFKLKDKYFYNCQAEDFIPKEEYDAVFTCPPYFNTERYDNENTSTSKFLDYFSWLNTWWRKVVLNSIKNNPKYFAFVISNKYKKDMSKICIQEGLTFIEEIQIGSNHLDHFQKKFKISKKGEFLLVFKK